MNYFVLFIGIVRSSWSINLSIKLETIKMNLMQILMPYVLSKIHL